MAVAPGRRDRRIPYTKPWRSFADQVALLESRGTVIPDREASERFLAHVNYYRFSGYCLAFEEQRHAFNGGVTFDQVRATYEFDQLLRDLVSEALEVVEVDVRTAAAYHFGQRYGPFGHLDPAHFHRRFQHHDWSGKLRHEAKRSNELFVKHYEARYTNFPDLPVWIVTEVMSFGSLSMMFKHMHKPDQKQIAARYGVQSYHFQSWLHHLVYVRNICAHHGRLWDRVWAIKPALPPGQAWSVPNLPGNDRFGATLFILNQLLTRCAAAERFHREWRGRMARCLDSPPSCPNALTRMGLTLDWVRHPLW